MKTTHYNCRARLQTLVLMAIFAISSTALRAQTVTLSPNTGNVVAAVSYPSELGVSGYGGTWIHNQLPMALTVSDRTTLTSKGLIGQPANNLSANTDGSFYVIGGSSYDCYMALSLPKGYHFTGYRIVFACEKGQVTSSTSAQSDATLHETQSSFTTDYVASAKATASNGNQTLQRTATKVTPMGNILYFRLERNDGGFVRIRVKSFVISFDCAEPFTEVLQPTSASTAGADCLLLPFDTERIDFGQITWASQNNNAAFRYNYNNIKDMKAYFSLYDEDGINADGSADPDAKKSGNITTVSADGSYYYGLQNDVYYLEVPTDAEAQAANGGTMSVPVGYRITAARLHYALAPEAAPALGGSFYITDGNGRYLNASLQYSSTPVLWQSDASGKVWTGSTYLKYNTSSLGSGRKFTLATTSSSSSAASFTLTDNHLSVSVGLIASDDYYISATSTTMTTSAASAATLSTRNPADGESSFTLRLYDKTGATVAAEAAVKAADASGTLEVTGLNNDAIKFEVADLVGQPALVYAELTLEALNPYISKMDVVATVEGGEETLSQSYLTDDFTVGEQGVVNFNVPDNFASQSVRITFDNLTNKKADDTYGPLASSGNARYHFVKSAYYELIGENLQQHRQEAADHAYTDKVLTREAGSQAFEVNNTSEFKTGTSQSSKSFYIEMHRYSHDAYAQQGGTWKELLLTRNDTEAKACYLVSCDETRYNIAPTTTPRHAFYAFYNVNVKLVVKDYEPRLTYVKVYDSAMLATGLDQNAYYGVKVGARMTETGETVAAGTGYLYAKQIVDQINADAGKAGCPKDAKHVLYMDASDLSAVLSSVQNEEKYGKIELIQDAIGQNAMIYLPAGITYTLKNIASKSVSGDFKAENNIILTDKQPFFAPYDIRVDASNYTQYTREVTANYGKSTYITLTLPFTVDICEDEAGTGVHTNYEGGSSFQFFTMQLSNALSSERKDNYDYEVTGHFTPTTGSLTESNKPYLVRVLSQETDGDANTNFVVRQNGANIVATPVDSEGLGTRLDGETATGQTGSTAVTLKHHGTLNGVRLAEGSGAYFYFAKNRFVLSTNLDGADRNVYIMPFRSYFDFLGDSQAKYMNVSLEPNADTTGISEAPADGSQCGFRLTAGHGWLTLQAQADGQACISNLSGQTVAQLRLHAGDSQSVALPAGIYLVNGAKVMVK